jgi:hypothetical protein
MIVWTDLCGDYTNFKVEFDTVFKDRILLFLGTVSINSCQTVRISPMSHNRISAIHLLIFWNFSSHRQGVTSELYVNEPIVTEMMVSSIIMTAIVSAVFLRLNVVEQPQQLSKVSICPNKLLLYLIVQKASLLT